MAPLVAIFQILNYRFSGNLRRMGMPFQGQFLGIICTFYKDLNIFQAKSTAKKL